jgi:O-antigen/teichoic acid export membrane protein
MFTFIAMVLVARILGKEAFGEFGLVRSTATTFVAFSSFGMGITATKYIAELLHTDKARAGRIIGLTYVFTFFTSLVVAVAFYLISPWLCETQLCKPELTNVMRLGAILLFLTTFMGTQIAVMSGFQDFRGLAFATLIGGITMLPVYVTGTYYWGICGAVIGSIFAVGLNIFINSGFIYRNVKKFHIRYKILDTYKERSILWNFNLPIVLSNSIYGFTILASQLLLTYCPNGLSELGTYYVAMNLYTVICFLPQQLLPVIFPIFSELNGEGNIKRFWRIVGKSWLLIFSISLFAIIPFLIFPKIFMGLFGNEFIGDWKVLFAVCMYVLTTSGTVIVNQIFICRGRNWFQLIWGIIWTIIYLCFVVLMLRENLGSTGLFWSAVIANITYSVSVAIYIYWSRKQNFINCC